MKEFVSTEIIAKKWKISAARVSVLCARGKVEGAKKVKGRWKIPADAQKPLDRKLKSEKELGGYTSFTFIDLFAGIGGFHQAMKSLGGKCVMAAEIDRNCVDTYKANYSVMGERYWGDVNEINPSDIPPFDVLCAGFPCQPFSKAGLQKGFEDEGRGNLFFSIMKILDAHPEVKFLLLENVRNLADKTQNWEIITTELQKRDFYITEKPIILSPTNFGLPQIRERVYILGINKRIKNDSILSNGCIHIDDLNLEEDFKECAPDSAWTILEDNVSREYWVSDEEQGMIMAWEEFRKGTNLGVIGFPIWISAFGLGITDQGAYKRSVKYNQAPAWKQLYFDRNRQLYIDNKAFIDEWVVRHNMLNRIKLFQKFEWNCGRDVSNIKDAIIQIRQSGIRAKRPTFFPSLVAMVNTPIVWDSDSKHFRYITEREAANLQNFNRGFKFVKKGKTAYAQLGNSVNVKVLKILTRKLFRLAETGWREEWEEN